MGTPSEPRNGDFVTLYDVEGRPHEFTVDFVDSEVVTLSNFGRVEIMTREQFAELFEGEVDR